MTIFAKGIALTATTDNLVYTVVGGPLMVSIFAWNSNSSGSVQCKIGIVPNGQVVGAASYFDGPMLDALQPLAREGIPLNTGDMVYMNPGASGVNGMVVGLP